MSEDKNCPKCGIDLGDLCKFIRYCPGCGKLLREVGGISEPEWQCVRKETYDQIKSEVKRLTEWQAVLKTLRAAIDAAGLDISPCMKCGCLVVCLPDGMPMCRKCAEQQEGGK